MLAYLCKSLATYKFIRSDRDQFLDIHSSIAVIFLNLSDLFLEINSELEARPQAAFVSERRAYLNLSSGSDFLHGKKQVLIPWHIVVSILLRTEAERRGYD